MDIKQFFTVDDKKRIAEAIKTAEKETSGEIRVHVATKCDKDPLDCARDIFQKLGMFETKEHDGVLFYISVEDRKFAILGDDNIYKKAGDDFWETVRNTVIEHFKQGKFGEGLEKGILMAGEKLSAFFPYQKDDINELPDAISYEGDNNE